MAKTMKQFYALLKFGPKNAPSIYVTHGLVLFLHGLKSNEICCQTVLFAVESRVVYCTNKLLSATRKGVLLALLKSNVIYQFSCHSNSRYVGRTSQRLLDRINNMSPNLSVLALPRNAYFLSVGANLPPRLIPRLVLLIQPLDFILCKIPPVLNILMTLDFLILPKDRSLFHLSALEAATFIETSNPALCRQKEFVYSLKIVH